MFYDEAIVILCRSLALFAVDATNALSVISSGDVWSGVHVGKPVVIEWEDAVGSVNASLLDRDPGDVSRGIIFIGSMYHELLHRSIIYTNLSLRLI